MAWYVLRDSYLNYLGEGEFTQEEIDHKVIHEGIIADKVRD